MAPKRKECPCKVDGVECTRRTISPNCHNTCPDWKEWKEWEEFHKSLRKEYMDAETATLESVRRQKKANRNDKKLREFGHIKY